MVERPEHIDFKYNWGVYWGLLKKYKVLLIIVLLTVLISEATYTADKFLFKVIVDKGTAYGANIITKDLFIEALIIIALIFIGVIIIRTLSKFFVIHLINRLEGNLIVSIKRKFFDHIITLSHTFHTSHRTGSMISRLVRGGNAIERMTDIIIFNIAPLIFQLIIVGGSLFYVDKISAAMVVSTVIIFIGYSIIIQNLSKKPNMDFNNAEDFEKGNISDFFTNIDSIKYFGKEILIKKRYEDISNSTKKLGIKNWDYYRWTDSGQSLILSIGTFFLIYFPLKEFLAGNTTLGNLIFIYTVYGNIVGSIFGFVHGIREYYRVMADFESLFEYNKIENDIKDKPNALKANIGRGSVYIKNISFSYGKREIFKNFSLRIPYNKKMALVGHSGSGKTTLVKLLYRLYDVNNGAILVDNIDIRDFKQESLRSEMSIVPQECVLFDDTIYNNIAFSNPQASREQVLQAIKFAQLDKIIQEFPNKEETIVGERGVKLSGGEKQRVSIARAILANKKILVLDEATSSLDSETEHEIQNDLEKLMKGRTSLIIAHRLSTIMKSDMIVVLKKGRIVQKGTHKQLIKMQGEYKKLWSLQKGGYIK